MPPNVTVVIPTFNRRHLIGDAIDSVLRDQGCEATVVVVDDGSTDGTAEWIRDRYGEGRVRVLGNRRTKGPGGARNTGILAAETDFIAFLDSDDLYLPGHLGQSLDVLQRRGEVDVVFGSASYEQDGIEVEYMNPNFERKVALAPRLFEDDELTVFSDGFFAHLLEHGCYFNLCTVCMRRDAAGALMNESLRVAEDYEFWVRLAQRRRFAWLHRRQVKTRLHSGNISFETADRPEQHAPSLLAAYELILRYEGLTEADARIIRRCMSSVFFDWAYRSRVSGRWADAVRLHLKSFALAKRFDNVVALAKLPFHAFVRRDNARTDGSSV